MTKHAADTLFVVKESSSTGTLHTIHPALITLIPSRGHFILNNSALHFYEWIVDIETTSLGKRLFSRLDDLVNSLDDLRPYLTKPLLPAFHIDSTRNSRGVFDISLIINIQTDTVQAIEGQITTISHRKRDVKDAYIRILPQEIGLPVELTLFILALISPLPLPSLRLFVDPLQD